MYDNFYKAMRDVSDIVEVSKVNYAVREISANLAAVILFGPSFMNQAKRNKHHVLNNVLVAYAKRRRHSHPRMPVQQSCHRKRCQVALLNSLAAAMANVELQSGGLQTQRRGGKD